MKWIFLCLWLVPGIAHAQQLAGMATAIDGDTLDMGGVRVRLFGMDAVESRQTCTKAGQSWPCGEQAKALLEALTVGKQVDCEQRDVDRYQRVVAVCSAGGLDLGRSMVEGGLAVALPEFTDVYVATEATMRQHAVGIWAGEFERPAAYRAARPQEFRPAPPKMPLKMPLKTLAPRRSRTGSVFFANCAEAWAAGAAPIYAGQPGYRLDMDGDMDGIACEPARNR